LSKKTQTFGNNQGNTFVEKKKRKKGPVVQTFKEWDERRKGRASSTRVKEN